MKENIFLHLIGGGEAMMYNYHGKEQTDNSQFDYGRKSITIIKALDLNISFG